VDAELRLAGLRLGELRRGRGVSQTAVADVFEVTQPNVSRIEKEEDLRLSTLARYIAAVGGDLQLSARFPDGVVDLLPPIGSGGAAENA